MLASLLFTDIFGWNGKKEGNYSSHSMLHFPLLMSVTSASYYLSIKDKYQKLYVRTYCLFKLSTVTDTIDYESEVIAKNICYISTKNGLILSPGKYKGYCR